MCSPAPPPPPCSVVSNIFTIHANNCVFAGLFTYLWWDVCGVRLRYTSSVLAAAAFVVPFFPTALLAVPGAVQLLIWSSWPAALLFFAVYALVTYQVYWAFLGTGQHSHYSVLGLSIIAGISTFGLQGAVLGPLLTSAVSAMHQLLSKHVQGLRQSTLHVSGSASGLGDVLGSPMQSPILHASQLSEMRTPGMRGPTARGTVRFSDAKTHVLGGGGGGAIAVASGNLLDANGDGGLSAALPSMLRPSGSAASGTGMTVPSAARPPLSRGDSFDGGGGGGGDLTVPWQQLLPHPPPSPPPPPPAVAVEGDGQGEAEQAPPAAGRRGRRTKRAPL
jgi:hypothetical protein